MNTIGWKETFDLPELGIFGITAKVDTGAASSVLHCESSEIIEIDQVKHIRFTIEIEPHHFKELCLPIHKEKWVRSSFGNEELRHYILTKAHIYNQDFDILISFRDRSTMQFPMLLGRNFIHKKFVVDVSKSNLSKRSISKK